MKVWLIRALFAVIFTTMTSFMRPFGLSPPGAIALGLSLSVIIVLFELNIVRSSSRTLVGAALGSLLGLVGASLISLTIHNMSFFSAQTTTFLQVLVLASMTYVGFAVGISKGDLVNLNLGGLIKERSRSGLSTKILDTSVVIDGRVADIIETGFLGGRIVVPEFVLRELQQVADSPDSIKRNRGRRGLDILRRIQKKGQAHVQILNQDYPELDEVDLKLIQLAKDLDGKIVTNDFNLNKVAQLHGVAVLNINELANSLKPVVLPGESMSVFILKEGKEYNQGVAYLDDGTMVVVDNARRMIGKNIDMHVTSVLQTTAGKMIFGRAQADSSDSEGHYPRQKVSRL